MITLPLQISPAGEIRNPTHAATSLGCIAWPCGMAEIARASTSAVSTLNKGVSVIAGASELTAIGAQIGDKAVAGGAHRCPAQVELGSGEGAAGGDEAVVGVADGAARSAGLRDLCVGSAQPGAGFGIGSPGKFEPSQRDGAGIEGIDAFVARPVLPRLFEFGHGDAALGQVGLGRDIGDFDLLFELAENAILAAAPGAQEIADRRSAIAAAIAASGPDDIVLIAGKGHEQGQIVGDRVLPFDDVVVARECAI